MRRFFFILLCLLVLGGCVRTTETVADKAERSEEIRAVWISYCELTMDPAHCSRADYEERIAQMVVNIRDAKLNTVFFHVRPFSDAMYRSDLFPYSACITGTEGKDPQYDPLALFCAYAENAGLSVHAWINPFRVCSKKDYPQKARNNPALTVRSDDDPTNDNAVVELNDMIYYDPASPWVQSLIADGVRELLERYPIDGIHIDDYFYPGTDERIDDAEYEEYRQQGGVQPRAQWRRTVVSRWVASIRQLVKSYGDDKIFSISPSVQIKTNYAQYYADVERWASYDGYCDWLIPQLYVGFQHETVPFRQAADQWNGLVRNHDTRLLFGLAAYKRGEADRYAGTGAREWIDNNDILPRQIDYIRGLPKYSGFALFSYAYIFDTNPSLISDLEALS